MGFVLGNSKSKHLLFLKGGLDGEILSYNILWKFHTILTQVEWWISQFPYKRTQDFHLWVPRTSSMSTISSSSWCCCPSSSRRCTVWTALSFSASSLTFFQANIFTRMRWMFRKPTKKHTVVLLREKASTTQLRRKQDSDSHFIMFCARLTWVMLVMFDQPCNIKLLKYQITWQFCVCDLQGLGIKKNFTACCVTLRANNALDLIQE